MNHNQFIQKSLSVKGAVSIQGFLEGAKEFLTKGSLGAHTHATLKELSENKVSPEFALTILQKVVFQDMLLASSKSEKPSKSSAKSEKPSKNYLATIYSPKGEFIESKEFDSSVSAEKWIDSRIVESVNDYGVITHSHTNINIQVNRVDSIRRRWCAKGGPAMHKKNKAGSWANMKVSNTRVMFSHG